MSVRTITATKDATMKFEGDYWSGYDLHLPVGKDNDSNETHRSVVYFPISFTGITSITSAILKLTGSVGGHITSNETRMVTFRRMTFDWGEGSNTGEDVWTNQTWGWENRGSTYTLTGGYTDYIFTGGVTDETEYDIDITDIVTSWFGGSPNYGLIMIAVGEGIGDVGVEFYSRNAAADLRPTLEITYEGNVAPNAPINLAPPGSLLVNSSTPTLSGSYSDPDADDGISAYQIRLYGDDGTTLIWDSGSVPGRGITVGSGSHGSGGVTQWMSDFSQVYSGPALSGNTFYKWKARTRDKGSLWGPYSALQRFKVNTPPNPPVVALSQSPLSDIRTLTPTINVTHSDNDPTDNKMYGYRVDISTTDGTVIWDSGNVDTSGTPLTIKTFTYAGPSLSWRTTYRIRARTRDSNMVWGNYSARINFSTHSTAVPINLNPNGEVVGGLTPIFSGERGSTTDNLSTFRVIVYNAANTQIWDSLTQTTIAEGRIFSLVYAGPALSYNAGYSWKARVTGSIGGTSEYSALQPFTTPASASVVTQNLPTPNNLPTNANVSSLTPTFTGSASPNFTDINIQVYPATSTSSDLGTPIWDSGTLTQASAGSFSKVYAGSALSWGTTYKWRVRVGTSGYGAWSGLSAFTTDLAGTPVNSDPADGDWITDTTPSLEATTGGSDLAEAYQILLYEEDNVTLKWDTGWVSQSASTNIARVYDGPTLLGGRDYHWQVRYERDDGVIGSYSARTAFHINAAPSTPSQLYPPEGEVFGDTLFPTFRAYFNDQDKTTRADYPTEWHIEVLDNDTEILQDEIVVTTNLSSGLNEYTWTGGDTGLAYGQDYKWRTWFYDSKGVEGAKSGYRIFSLGQSGTLLLVSPSNGSNIATSRPTILWTFTGDRPQNKYRIRVVRDLTDVTIYDSGEVVSSANSVQLPTGFINYNDEFYTIRVYVKDTANIASNIENSTVQLTLDAPPAIEGLSATVYEDRSLIRLDWDTSNLGSNFLMYVIYRRLSGSDEWGYIGMRNIEGGIFFNDWYAGQQTNYEYRVTVVKKIADEPDVESPDSDIVQARLESDVWFVVGKDRSEAHTFELPVESETHTRPVQQEAFEPLGTNRKAVVRGFVLGSEGQLTVNWTFEEKIVSDEQINYIIYNAGPHILKNPFGDVYEVTFGTVDGQYSVGGLHNVTLVWIETGSKTNNPLLTPDEFLATIGAE